MANRLPAGRDLSRDHSRIEFTVRAGARERLDQYLQRRLGWDSRSKIQQLIRLGRVRLNARAAKPSARVCVGDRVEVRLLGDADRRTTTTEILVPLWEDAYLVALDKPAGHLVHPVGRTVQGTVINAVHLHYRPLYDRGHEVLPKLCHRLDRETSGVLLLAKSDHARRRLQDAFEADEVEKEYWAIVEGIPPLSFEIRVGVGAFLDRSLPHGHRLARACETGKPACTAFRTLKIGPGFSLVSCRPRTGRQNQIRVHLAEAGHPILGDVGYGSARAEGAEAPPFPERALLHSAGLRFPHPVWRTLHRVRSAPPADFLPYLEALSGQPLATRGAARRWIDRLESSPSDRLRGPSA